MRVKIYSISNCRYCNILKEVLTTSLIPFDEVKVRRLVDTDDSEGMPFDEYIKLEPDVELAKKCIFPQVYIDGKYIGDMKETLNYLFNETK